MRAMIKSTKKTITGRDFRLIVQYVKEARRHFSDLETLHDLLCELTGEEGELHDSGYCADTVFSNGGPRNARELIEKIGLVVKG